MICLTENNVLSGIQRHDPTAACSLNGLSRHTFWERKFATSMCGYGDMQANLSTNSKDLFLKQGFWDVNK